jgi:hypothetical protein
MLVLELLDTFFSFYAVTAKKLAKNDFYRYALAHVDNAAQPWHGQLISRRR